MNGMPQQWADRVRQAAAQGTALRIRGGGTKDFWGGPAAGELLDTTVWSGISCYEPSELVVTVRAGTPLAALEAQLAQAGQCLPFEPPHLGPGATVGGMVAAGWAGPARANVGGVRDYVLGLALINGQGQLLTFGGQVMKNVAGYDVSRLMVGAWGTLGLITDVSLKVLPVAPAEATLRFECSQAEALQRLQSWGAQPLPLNASRWLEEDGVARLYVRLRGAAPAVDAACASMGGERLPAAEAAAGWHHCREHTLPWFACADAACGLWRLSVPAVTPVLDLPQPAFMEWHGALRWVHAPVQQAARLQEMAARAGGRAELFRLPAGHTAGLAVPRAAPVAEPLARIQRQLKQAFDPAGVFNPGRTSFY